MRMTPDYRRRTSICAGFFTLLVFPGHAGFVQRERRCAGTLLLRLTIGLFRAAISDTRLLRPVAIRLLLLLLVLLHLRLLRGQDAKIMFGVLQIVLGHDAIARGVRVARQLQILLVDMRRRPADLHFRSVRIERTVRVVAATSSTTTAVVDVAAVISLRPAAASTRTFHLCPC